MRASAIVHLAAIGVLPIHSLVNDHVMLTHATYLTGVIVLGQRGAG